MLVFPIWFFGRSKNVVGFKHVFLITLTKKLIMKETFRIRWIFELNLINHSLFEINKTAPASDKVGFPFLH